MVVAAALSLTVGCTSLGNLPRPELVAGVDWSGLEPVAVKGVDLAYFSPAADFAGYSRLMLDPIQVSFNENWEPTQPGSAFGYSERDIEALREDIAEQVHERFVRYIERGGRYDMADTPGPGVLRVRAQVVDVRLNAPDIPTAIRSEQYARSAGEMTLVMELVDAESGALVGRIIDRWIDPEENWPRRITRMENYLAISEAVDSWAGALKRHLEVVYVQQRMHDASEGIKRVDAP